MKIIQTFKDEDFKCGFPTRESALDYLRKSYATHSKLTETVIYVDKKCFAYLSAEAPELNIVQIEFERIDARFWNLPKLQVQALQTEPYIHVDIDATLFELPVTKAKVITEAKLSCFCMHQYQFCGLQPSVYKPASGLIGFTDMQLQKEYIPKAIELIRNWGNKLVNFESLWTVEELLLANLCDHNDWHVLQNYEHLQGGMKR